MAVQKIVTANPYRKFDSATVLFAGAVPSNSRVVTNVDGIEHMGYHSGRAGSALPSPLSDATISANTAGDAEPAAGRSKNPTYKPLAAGTFGYMAAGKYVAKKLAVTLSGVANTVLYTGAADYGRKPTYLRSGIRTSYLYAWTWTADNEGAPTYSKTYHNRTPAQNDMNGQDEASVLVTRALPGEIQFLFGAKTPLQANYPARTG